MRLHPSPSAHQPVDLPAGPVEVYVTPGGRQDAISTPPSSPSRIISDYCYGSSPAALTAGGRSTGRISRRCTRGLRLHGPRTPQHPRQRCKSGRGITERRAAFACDPRHAMRILAWPVVSVLLRLLLECVNFQSIHPTWLSYHAGSRVESVTTSHGCPGLDLSLLMAPADSRQARTISIRPVIQR